MAKHYIDTILSRGGTWEDLSDYQRELLELLWEDRERSSDAKQTFEGDDTCCYCGKPATKLCDFRFRDDSTCDRAMCDNCVGSTSPIFFDGDKEHTGVDSMDYCQTHTKIPDGFEPRFNPIGGGSAA